MTGMRFGRLTVIRFSHIGNDSKAAWVCQCDCGSAAKAVGGRDLRQGKVKSCGCLRREGARRRHEKDHPKKGHPPTYVFGESIETEF